MRSKVVSPCYVLGRTKFTVECCDQHFVDQLNVLIPQSETPCDSRCVTVEAGCIDDIYALMRHIRMKHSDCVWMDAACLRSPAGKKVLLVGGSNAGKSTTALALALKYDWKVMSEDVTLFDLQTNQILSFPTPFSIKAHTRNIIRNTIGIDIDRRTRIGEWLPMADLAWKHHEPSNDINLVIFFPEFVEPSKPFTTSDVTPADLIRQLLPWSSILRVEGAIDRLADYFSTAKCVTVFGGTLAQRIDFILKNTIE